jgi:hypothetical protein
LFFFLSFKKCITFFPIRQTNKRCERKQHLRAYGRPTTDEVLLLIEELNRLRSEAIERDYPRGQCWGANTTAIKRAVEANLMTFADHCDTLGLHRVREKLVSLGHYADDTLVDVRRALKEIGKEWTPYAATHKEYVRFARRHCNNVIMQWIYRADSLPE